LFERERAAVEDDHLDAEPARVRSAMRCTRIRRDGYL
jgi:hypothetical protein